MIGQTISHYKILEKLGEGGMGVVYKAQDTTLDRLVALKFLPSHASVNEETKARFLQEAKAAAALNHNNICTIYGVEEGDSKMFIVMEYVDGGTLHDRLPFARPDDAISTAIQIGEALQEAHSKGIVHRDIKADNIMLTSKGQVKVMDFGLAKLRGSLKLTRSSSTVGTLAYMAPEQIQGGEVDARSDIFAFGVLLFEMLTGTLPFRGEHEAAMMYSILNEEPSSIRNHKPDISSACERILEKALEKNPEERYQSAADMVADLKRWKRDTTGVHRPTTQQVQKPEFAQPAVEHAMRKSEHTFSFSKKSLRLSVIAGILAVVIAGLFLFHPWTQKSTDRKTLVVLPFENQSDASREYFSDGITEEITTRLSGLSGLGVIARSSARTYKGSKKSVKDIGNELGVQYVLEGTVQWSGQQVRVIPELINVSSGLQAWSQTFDASVSDAFSLQSSIASKVAEALDVKLLKPEAVSLEQKLTTNAQAYDYYLQGIEYSTRSISRSDNEIAEDLFQRAIQADPSFAAAYAQLSTVHSNMYWFFYDRTQSRVDEARRTAEKALVLDPNLPEAHAAMGWYYYHGLLDYTNSLKEFSAALDLRPGNSDVYYGMASVYRRQGRMTEAIEAFQKAVKGNPRVADLVRQLGETMTLARQYAKADEAYGRSLALAPDIQTVYAEKARNLILWKGDIPAAVDLIKQGRLYGSVKEDKSLDVDAYAIATMTGKLAEAEQIVNSMAGDGVSDQFLYRPKSLLLAEVAFLQGNSAKAHRYFEEARRKLEMDAQSKPNDERIHSALGIAYAGLGRKEDAIGEGQRGVNLLPVEKEAWRGTFRLADLAQILAMTGNQDKAIDLLKRLLSIPSEFSATSIRLDPRWNSLHGTKRFEELIRDK
jgi:eukaryotic-like serine/threonine-protein kinase